MDTMTTNQGSPKSPDAGAGSSARLVLALSMAALVIAYTGGVVIGKIPQEHQLSAVHVGIIALTAVSIVALLRPTVLQRLKLLEMGGFKLEMLERVKEKQAKQESQLEDIGLILPLLFTEAERKHLLNLESGKTSEYKGNHALRVELRRLRSAGLIGMRGDQHISELKDGNAFDLANYIELTRLGRRWIERIKEIQKAELPEEENKAKRLPSSDV